MGEKTGIAWTDHTFNPWIGCTKVSAGCVNCYACRENNRFHWVNKWGVDYKRTSPKNWLKPIEWAKNAVREGVVRRVFCASLADVYDVKAEPVWRYELWQLIKTTARIGGLEWLILTKRPENIRAMTPKEIYNLEDDCVRIGITAENQEMYDIRHQTLIDNWLGFNFISVEPMIGPLKLDPTLTADWVIAGCESGDNARECDPRWVYNLMKECEQKHIPFFLKQLRINGRLVVTPKLNGKQYLEFPER